MLVGPHIALQPNRARADTTMVDRTKGCGVLALALLMGGSCKSSESPVPADSGPVKGRPDGRPIELLSWWAALGQSDPVGALIAEHAKRFPEDYVINARTLLSARARSTITARMMSGEPPDVFQCNVGYDMRQWVSGDGVGDRDSKLARLDEIFPELWKAVPSKLLDYISYQGKLYGVPATVHRLNAMFFNKAVLAAHGLAPPASVTDLKAAGRKLHAAGIPLFAINGKEPWQLGQLVFEDLIIAREGPDFYRSYFGGAERPDDPRIVKMLEEALELLLYANTDWQDRSFLDASDMVAQGKAAISVGGDWMTVYYAPDGLTEESPIGEAAFPGTETTFLFTSDLFSLPVRAKNPAGAKRFLSTVISAEAQRVLAKVKGCISPRTDVNDAGATAIQRQKAELLRNGDLVLALSGLVPKQFHDDVSWALIDMAKQRKIEPALQMLRSRYHLLVDQNEVKWCTRRPSGSLERGRAGWTARPAFIAATLSKAKLPTDATRATSAARRARIGAASVPESDGTVGVNRSPPPKHCSLSVAYGRSHVSNPRYQE